MPLTTALLSPFSLNEESYSVQPANQEQSLVFLEVGPAHQKPALLRTQAFQAKRPSTAATHEQ